MYARIKNHKSNVKTEEYDQQLQEVTARLASLRAKCEKLLQEQGLEPEEIARVLTNYRDYENMDHRDLTIKKIMAAYRNRVIPLHDDWAKLTAGSPHRKTIEVFDSYDIKNHLRKRGYTFHGHNNSWSIVTFTPEQCEQELEFLKSQKVEIRTAI